MKVMVDVSREKKAKPMKRNPGNVLSSNSSPRERRMDGRYS